MKQKSVFVFISAVMCLLLVGCGANDYPTYTYELYNGLGESYIVNYCEQVSYPKHTTHVRVFSGKNKISDYDGGEYTSCDSYTPDQVMYVCTKDKVDYYYLRNQLDEYIVADGVSSIRMNYNMMKLGLYEPEMDDFEKRTYSKLADILRAAITADEAQARFDACGYYSGSFMQLYYYVNN